MGFTLGEGGAPTIDEQRTTLVQTVVESADRLWAAAVADPKAPTDALPTVFGGDRLNQVQADLNALRANGQRIEAHLTAPVSVLSASGPPTGEAAVAAVVRERMDVRRFNAEGSLASTQSGPVVHHYVLQQSKDGLWQIIAAEEMAPP